MVRLRATIDAHGRVQGVGFRAWVRDRLTSGGLTGRAENRDDGTVHVVAEGAPDAVEVFVEDVRQHAPGEVERVVVAVEELDDA